MRRSALLALALGGGVAIAAQLAAPTVMPLYDGVVAQDPYRYLTPAAGQTGDPTSYAGSPGLDAGASRSFVAATTENPPQAQLIALPKALVPPPGATSMNVTIDAVPPELAPATGAIAGNVYRFMVIDDNGADYTIAAGAQPTITLRSPDGVLDAVIGHLTADGWVALATEHGGGLGLFAAEPTELGDYALLTGISAPSDLGRFLIVILTIGLPLLAAIAYVARRTVRSRRAEAEAADAARAHARIPSKRRKRR